MIPEPYYSLIKTSKGDDLAVVVVNTALRKFEDRGEFPWHLHLIVECQLLAKNGMPTSEELIVLERFEEDVTQALQCREKALFLARVTCRGERQLIYRVHDPEIANDLLQAFLEVSSRQREWQYRMEHDPDWVLAKPELELVGYN